MVGSKRKKKSDCGEENKSDDRSDQRKRNSRMRDDEEEIYLKLCIENFQAINDTTTGRGTPNATKIRKDKENLAWENIAREMNQRNNVSFQAKNDIH